MKRGKTGYYEITIAAGEKIHGFVPKPLPPEVPIELNNVRQKLLERANLALGRLDSISLLLPDPDIFLYTYVRREAVLSSQIEGTQSSLAQLLLFELEEAPGVPFDDVMEVSNYVLALKHGLDLAKELPLCTRLIKEMHSVLLSRGRGSNKSPGEFRKTQNWIGGTRPGNAVFVPPPPHKVSECMSDLERFLNEDNNYPALIKAALAHVQFETIHPFLDGNGRIGRLLIAFILHYEQVLSQPLLYLSLYFKKHRSEYYRLLDIVRKEGDWEAWIDFFLEGVEFTATNAVETANGLVSLFQRDEQKVQQLGRRVSSAYRVFRVFCERPIVNINQMCNQTSLSFPAVNKAIESLEQIGIIREITGKQRNRVYAYERYLSILNEGITI